MKVEYRNNGYIVGVDEAGRGAWAGPLVVCAFAAPKDWMAPWVKDSKKYSKREQRQKVVDYLRGLENAYWCLQWVDPSEIDERGLDFCHREALRASVDVMYHMMNNDNPGYPERIIIDGANYQDRKSVV